jgi:hypothetical protein
VDAARIIITYDSTTNNGSTKRELLEYQNIIAPEPEIYVGTEYLLDLFFELDRGRQFGFGVCPLTWQDIKAYSDVTGYQFSKIELDILMSMDKAAVLAYNQTDDMPKDAKGVSF